MKHNVSFIIILMYEDYPRVTQILQSTAPIQSIIKFKKLKDKYEEENGVGSWDTNCEKSRTNGTNVHAFLDTLVRENTTCLNDIYAKLKTKIDDFNDYHKQAVLYHKHHFASREPIFTELPIFNHTLKYRGTTDLVFYDYKDNSTVLLDYKTSKGYVNSYTDEIIWRWKLMATTAKCKAEKEKCWTCISDRCLDPFTQIMMYKLGIEENKSLTFNNQPVRIDKLLICVITPYGYQELMLPRNMWVDCHQSVKDRISAYYRKLKQQQNENDNLNE